VLDYKSKDIVEQLKKKGQIFNLCVDNVGTPSNLYKVSDFFLVPDGKFVQVGMALSLASAGHLVRNLLLPAFLGGGKRQYQVAHARASAEDFRQLGVWLKDGIVKAVIDEIFGFDDAPKAFEKLKTGRTKGKIVVKVKKE
jgi:NADPH:quinone reductase-like Zn-dependent oxidoreductase